MRQRVCLSTFLLCFFCICIDPTVANEYIIRYQTQTAGTIFHVESKNKDPIGKVVRNKKNESVSYTFFAPDEQLLAIGRQEQLSQTTSVYLTNEHGESIGHFAAQIQSNLYPTEYTIYSNHGLLTAKGYLNWLGNTFYIVSADNPRRFITTYFRPRFRMLNDNWHFEIHEKDVIDFRLLSIMGVFQTLFDLHFELLDPKSSLL